MLGFPLFNGAGEGGEDRVSGFLSATVDQLTPDLTHVNFVTDLAIIMIIGAVVTLAFFKIRQPLIIGYLFAGMLIGPLSPFWSWLLPDLAAQGPDGHGEGTIEIVGLVADITALNLFAEIGVILLLFVIGIEFPYAKIKSMGRSAVGIGSLGLLSTMGVVFYVATALGMVFMDALFLAAALSISSTAIIVKIFEEMGRIKEESSVLVLGILIVEDVIAVILISSLQSVALVGSVSIESIVVVVMVATGMIAGTLLIGTRIIPHLIDRVAAMEHREILLLSLLGICFGYALFANLMGLSVAIGAFLAGVLVAESKSAEVARVLSNPIKDMFVAIFFISVGALMDVSQLNDYIFLAVALILASMGMKFGGEYGWQHAVPHEAQKSPPLRVRPCVTEGGVFHRYSKGGRGHRGGQCVRISPYRTDIHNHVVSGPLYRKGGGQGDIDDGRRRGRPRPGLRRRRCGACRRQVLCRGASCTGQRGHRRR